jgi:hypothetical protein
LRVKFKPRCTIRRVANGESIVAFTTSGEYEGELLVTGEVLAESKSCDRLIKLRKSEINIVKYLV